MVDELRVAQLLRRVHQNLEHLRRRAAMDRDQIRADLDRLTALKHFFQTTIEGCIDVAQHLCASEGWARCGPTRTPWGSWPATGSWTATWGGALAEAVGFRNVIVHEYAEVDDELVLAHLDDLEPFGAFVAEVSAWLEAQTAPPA